MKKDVDENQTEGYQLRVSQPQQKMKTTRILMRTKPCNCGCKGTDSWHLMWFKRVVKTTDGKTGTIKTPWGEEEVEMGTLECDGKLHNTYWKKKGLRH